MSQLARKSSPDNEPYGGLGLRTLTWAYDHALVGLPGTPSAQRIGDDYRSGDGSLEDQVDRLIKWQIVKTGATGFVTSMGGVAVPVTLPASLTSVVYVQLRMIAAIAHMGGHDVRSDAVRSLAYACLCGNAAKNVVKEVGIKLGTKVTRQAIHRISSDALHRINRRVGFELVTKFGGKGVINLGRMVPVAGGAVGAFFDGASTYAVGRVAKETFIKA